MVFILNTTSIPDTHILHCTDLKSWLGLPLFILPVEETADWKPHWDIVRNIGSVTEEPNVSASSLTSRGKVYFLYARDYGTTWLASTTDLYLPEAANIIYQRNRKDKI